MGKKRLELNELVKFLMNTGMNEKGFYPRPQVHGAVSVGPARPTIESAILYSRYPGE